MEKGIFLLYNDIDNFNLIITLNNKKYLIIATVEGEFNKNKKIIKKCGYCKEYFKYPKWIIKITHVFKNDTIEDDIELYLSDLEIMRDKAVSIKKFNKIKNSKLVINQIKEHLDNTYNEKYCSWDCDLKATELNGKLDEECEEKLDFLINKSL